MDTSGFTRIVERFVSALAAAAEEGLASQAVEKDLQALQKALATSEDLRKFLVNPLVPPIHQADALVEIATKMQLHAITKQFLAMLARQKRLMLLPEIITQFAETAAAARGEMKAELIVAAPIEPSAVAAINARLDQAYGKKVQLDVKQDPSLLGGVIVKIGSMQLDGSLSGKLNRLGMKLKAA